jgi:hypothetical protein
MLVSSGGWNSVLSWSDVLRNTLCPPINNRSASRNEDSRKIGTIGVYTKKSAKELIFLERGSQDQVNVDIWTVLTGFGMV